MILVTGGSGFLGSKVVELLLKRRKKVRVLDMQKPPTNNVEYVRGDITDYDTVLKATEGCSTIIHIAALMGEHRSQNELNRVNVGGTENVMKAAQETGARVIYCSSSTAERGDTKYSKSKKKAEEVALSYADDVPLVILRPSPMYGVGSKAFYKLLRYIEKGWIGQIGKDYTTHLTFRDKAAEAFVLAMKKGKRGAIYAIADKEPVRASVLYDFICKNLGVKRRRTPYLLAYVVALFMEIRYALTGKIPPITRGYLKRITLNREYDISKAIKELGYEPVTTQEGFERMIRWYKSTKEKK